MQKELIQVGRDAESLARYIMEYGDQADKRIIEKQIGLIVMHGQDLKETKGQGV